MRERGDAIRAALFAVALVLALAAVLAANQLPRPEVLSRTGNAPTRAATWAEAVEACESRGGAAVVRATRALGRSADLPACVPQLGD